MFITLEGIEGAGKTTQLEKIVAFIRSKGYECVISREPGGTLIGRQIRGVLLDPANKGMDATTELLLYIADRVEHIHTFIQPHVAAGRVVVCDRYFDATMVYQGYARGLDKVLIRNLHREVCNGLQPDLTLLFDLSPEIGLARARKAIDSGGRAKSETRFENEKLAFHHKVREGYLDMARQEPNRFHIIDAGQIPEEVAFAIETRLAPLFPNQSA